MPIQELINVLDQALAAAHRYRHSSIVMSDLSFDALDETSGAMASLADLFQQSWKLRRLTMQAIQDHGKALDHVWTTAPDGEALLGETINSENKLLYSSTFTCKIAIAQRYT